MKTRVALLVMLSVMLVGCSNLFTVTKNELSENSKKTAYAGYRTALSSFAVNEGHFKSLTGKLREGIINNRELSEADKERFTNDLSGLKFETGKYLVFELVLGQPTLKKNLELEFYFPDGAGESQITSQYYYQQTTTYSGQINDRIFSYVWLLPVKKAITKENYGSQTQSFRVKLPTNESIVFAIDPL